MLEMISLIAHRSSAPHPVTVGFDGAGTVTEAAALGRTNAAGYRQRHGISISHS